ERGLDRIGDAAPGEGGGLARAALLQPLPAEDFFDRAPDHVFVGEAGQRDAAPARVDYPRLAVAYEEGGVRRRVVVVEQLEHESEAAFGAALWTGAETGGP